MMKNIVRVFVIGLCFGLSTVASALVQPVTGTEYRYTGAVDWQSSASSACEAGVPIEQASAGASYTVSLLGVVLVSAGQYACTMQYKLKSSGALSQANRNLSSRSTAAACPANSSAVSGGCQCNATFDEVGGQCLPHTNKCSGSQGKTGVLNWTEGYTRTPDEGDRRGIGAVYSPGASGNVCMGGCAVSLQTSGPGVQPLVSQSPTAQGLYRRSVDYPYLALGTECTQGTADIGADKSVAPPDCPGTVGEYSGKPACFGTAAKPVTTAPIGQPAGAAIAGNPKAGDKPATGEGSGTGSAGRTPSTGNGDAEGGPSSAAVGGKGGDAGGTTTGSGTTPKPADGEEQAACGAPGQPVCAVKVDERGTPTGANGTDGTSYATKVDDLTKAQTDAFASVKDAKPGDWGFDFQLPTTCSPIALGMFVQGFQIDMCRWQSMIHDLMSLVWLSITVWTCIGMVGRTLSGGS